MRLAEVVQLHGILLHVKQHARISFAIDVFVVPLAQNKGWRMHPFTCELNQRFIFPRRVCSMQPGVKASAIAMVDQFRRVIVCGQIKQGG